MLVEKFRLELHDLTLLRQILRFDDTNPNEEDQVYFDAIQDIIKWLGTFPLILCILYWS